MSGREIVQSAASFAIVGRMALKAALERRTIRQYVDYVIPKDDLKKIEAALLNSPTGMNTQGLNFLIVTNQAKLAEASKAVYDKMADEFKGWFSPRTKLYGVKDVLTCDASAVVFVYDNGSSSDKTFLQVDAGIATATILLVAQELGLASMVMGLFKFGEGAFEKVIGIPEGSFIIAVALGKAAPGAVVKEKAITAKVGIVE